MTLSEFESVKHHFKMFYIHQRISGPKFSLLKIYIRDIRWNNVKQILGFTFGNVDVSTNNWEPKIKKNT